MHERIATAQQNLVAIHEALQAAQSLADQKEQSRALSDIARQLRQLAFQLDDSVNTTRKE